MGNMFRTGCGTSCVQLGSANGRCSTRTRRWPERVGCWRCTSGGARSTSFRARPSNGSPTVLPSAEMAAGEPVGPFSDPIPPRSPNLNAYAERFVRTIKECCLGRMIIFGERSLRNAIRQFVEHYHHGRNHQGLDNRLIDPKGEAGSVEGPLECSKRLGGLLRYYYREAA